MPLPFHWLGVSHRYELCVWGACLCMCVCLCKLVCVHTCLFVYVCACLCVCEIFESYFSDGLTLSVIRGRTSRRIYRLAVALLSL